MDEETHPIVASKEKEPFMAYCGFSNTTKVLAFGLFSALLAMVVLVIALGITATSLNQQSNAHCPQCNESNATNDSSICLTPSCVKLAATLLNNMNQTVHPCDDFYNFTCGGWVKKNIIPPGYSQYSTFHQLSERNNVALKKILDSGEDEGVEAVKKVIDLYQSCLNTTAVNLAGGQPLLELINITGGWSLFGEESGWSVNGTGFLAEKYYGSPAFFSMDVAIDDKNSSKYVIVVKQSGLSLASPSIYMDNRTATASKQALKTLMVSVLTLINSSMDPTVYEEVADDIIEFESQLAEVFYSNVELRDIDKTYNIRALGELTKLWPTFSWINFTLDMFGSVDVELNVSEVVIVRTPLYFINLTTIFDSTNRSVLENYAKWQLIQTYLPYLSDDFLQAYNLFTKTTQGTGAKERYTTCIQKVQDILPIALARPFTNFILPSGTKGNVSEMVDNVKTAFKERLESNDWLDNHTKTLCMEKVNAITKQIAFPEQLFNDTYLNNLYAEYNISTEDYFGNIRRSVGVMLEKDYRRLPKSVDKQEWLSAPTAVNAYYDPQVNGFVFLEGILNVPFFEAGWPNYATYGALGVVVGHELTHGFDDQGQRYNKDGILEPWWTNSSVKNFNERKECFVDQYSQYKLFGFNVNGSLTLGENIADNGGIKSSFQAYKDSVSKKQMKEQSLPGMSEYTPEQLYFISFGQVWCSLFSAEGISVSTKTDPHSPGPYRVIGSLVNSPEFASAFQCPQNSTMNPENKCLLW